MIGRRARTACSATALCLALLAGCGGEDDSTTTPPQRPDDSGGVAATGKGAGQKEERPDGRAGKEKAEDLEYEPREHRDSGGGAAQYEVRGGDNSVQRYGAEASTSEFEAAAAALHGFLDARAQHAWAAACNYLAGEAKQSFQLLERGPKGVATDCPAVLAGLSEELPASELRRGAIADVGSLRVEGSRGYLIYEGAGGVAMAVQMIEEGDDWKLASLSGLPLE